MRWLFKLLDRSERFIVYAYSVEGDSLDGRIVYDIEKNETKIAKPCSKDIDSEWRQKKTIEHFYKVKKEGFPEERYVCIG